MLYFLLREDRDRSNKRNLIASTLPTQERIPYVSEFLRFGKTWFKAFEAILNCLQEELLKALDNVEYLKEN